MHPEGAPPRARRFLKAALVAVSVLAVTGALVGWRASQADKPNPKPPEAARTFEFAPGDLAQLRGEPLGRQVPISGTLRPVLQATVRAKVAAEVTALRAQEGQPVEAGAVIVSLDTADLKARLDAQTAAVAEARARLDLARKNHATNQALLEKAFISQNAFDSVISSVQVAEANLASAEAQAAIARRAMEDTQVRAPFAGIVAKRWVNQGDKVAVDMPVAQVVDLTRMEIEAQIPAGEIPFVHVGQAIAVRIDGFAGRVFKGKVERVSPSAEAGSRSIAVFAALPNADRALRGGMFANGTVATGSGAEVDVIPTAAVIEEGGQAYVYVIRNEKVERRAVVLGEKSAERGLVVVREGLERGVPVIAVKAEGLKPGAKAIVKPAKG